MEEEQPPQAAIEQPDRFYGRKYCRRNFSWLKVKKKVDFDKRRVFDQSWYPCCSPVAVLEDVEVVYEIKEGRRSPVLSIQNLVNEVPAKYPDECHESNDISKIQPFPAHTALKYVKDHGVCLKEDFKFCWCKNDKAAPTNGKRMRIEDVEHFESDEISEANILSLIRQHPIVGEIEYYPHFLDHKDGIFKDPGVHDPECAHAVVITGYGTSNKIDFFEIKNSHGKKWGIRGISKVERSLFLGFARPVNPYMEQNEGRKKRKRRRKQ